MESNIKTLWIEALRSDDYSQGRDCLKSTTADGTVHCCLGVLCEVDNITFREDENRYGIDYSIVDVYHNHHDALLPDFLLQKYGLTSDEQVQLADMNDMGTSFTEIADYIEKNL